MLKSQYFDSLDAVLMAVTAANFSCCLFVGLSPFSFVSSD